ncbi:MAG: hypothetical protein AB1442_08810 [Nitrospirota bacterium]
MNDDDIARKILAYMIDNPSAQDTLDGIAEWWLLEQEIKFQREKVREALAGLVSKRLILEQEGGNSRLHYRINRTRIEEIRRIVSKTKLRY